MTADFASAGLVVDSSVAVKWFVSESELHVEEALALFRRQLSGEVVLAAPDLLLLEVSNALRSRGVPETGQKDVARALGKSRLALERVEALHEAAVSISIDCGLSVYDATFAALAQRLGVKLVTADRRLAESGACPVVLLGTGQKQRG